MSRTLLKIGTISLIVGFDLEVIFGTLGKTIHPGGCRSGGGAGMGGSRRRLCYPCIVINHVFPCRAMNNVFFYPCRVVTHVFYPGGVMTHGLHVGLSVYRYGSRGVVYPCRAMNQMCVHSACSYISVVCFINVEL